MSRDFAPCHHWITHKEFPDLHLSNIKMSYGNREWWMYTEEELEDRRKHEYIAVLGSDIYKPLREELTDTQFENLNTLLGKVVQAHEQDSKAPEIPEEVIDWYYNRHGHYYHEPNDEEFVEYIRANKDKLLQ